MLKKAFLKKKQFLKLVPFSTSLLLPSTAKITHIFLKLFYLIEFQKFRNTSFSLQMNSLKKIGSNWSNRVQQQTEATTASKVANVSGDRIGQIQNQSLHL